MLTRLGLFVALLVSNAIILYTDLTWSWLRLPAALALMLALPGWAWLPALGWLQTSRGLERIVLLLGFSSLLSTLALFITLFLPGPFTETPALIALNLTTLTGLIYQSVRHYQFKTFTPKPLASNPKLPPKASNSQSPRQAPNPQSKIEWPSRTVLLILIAILAVAAFTRLIRIGYAEFHEDELENMRLIVRAYKGEEYAPFLDSKGPVHWLPPAALWYLNGWINEGIARMPFAITSLLLIPLVYTLGRRMSGGHDHIGLLAAGFVAMNGFFVAYARHVENPSLIVFWGALAMWFAYRYYQEDLNHFLLYAALALAIALIAHPDILLYLPVFAYIIWIKWRYQPDARPRMWPWLVGAGALFGSLVAYFYVPYLTDPNISFVQQYFADDRLGRSFLYNRVDNMFDQDQLYTTRYHAPVLILLLFWLLARNFARWGRWGWIILSGLGLAMVSPVVWPDAWVVGNFNLAFVPYALLILFFILLPRTDFEIKTLFLWFMVPMGSLVFLAKDAADHIQVAYTGWALLSAFALADVWAVLSQPLPGTGQFSPSLRASTLGVMHSLWQPTRLGPVLKSIIVLGLTIIIALILYYQYLVFDTTVFAYWQAKIDSANNPTSIHNRLYGSIPRPRKIFSNPRLGGWKAVGYLWATHTLDHDFRSINESFAVPIWYTFQTSRSCYDDPQHYWLRRDWRGWPEEEQAIIAQGYSLTRIVLVDKEPKLHLYEKNVAMNKPEILDEKDYRRQFDYLATPARFAQEEIQGQRTAFDFGNSELRLLGYKISLQNVQPGDLVPVTVNWESLTYMETRYRGFVHLVDTNNTLWGQHDDDPACRLLTTDMRPGQRSSRQFRLPVNPDAPPGEYTIILGLYHPDTLERLEIWDNLAHQAVGNTIVLGQVKVE